MERFSTIEKSILKRVPLKMASKRPHIPNLPAQLSEFATQLYPPAIATAAARLSSLLNLNRRGKNKSLKPV
jgi:hypothetical protein